MHPVTRLPLLFGLLCLFAIPAANGAAADPTPTPGKNLVAASHKNGDTEWLHRAHYGVFMHYLIFDAGGLNGVDKFDVEALAGQLQAIGAKYFVLTLGQNSGYYVSPNAVYDRYTGHAPGERCAKRDLPLDLANALKKRGILLMLYLPAQTANADAQAQKAFGLPEGVKDQPIDAAFAAKWAQVIREWSDRYGDKVSGWWFDGCYPWVNFNDSIAHVYADAVKHGNRHALVAFNPGVGLSHYSPSEDYTAGETNEPFGLMPSSRWVGGSQWHALTYLGSHWAQRDTRFPAEQWAAWVKSVVAHGGVVTLDMGGNGDPQAGPIGSLAEAQVSQVKAIQAQFSQNY